MALSLADYKDLIAALKVEQQSFTTKKITWKSKEEKLNEILAKHNEIIFANNAAELTLSRQDVLDTVDPIQKILKTIYWGYSSGMRGKHFINILKNLDLIQKCISDLIQSPDNHKKCLEDLIKIEGIGLSTVSKFLYFFNIQFNDIHCQILDLTIIDVLNNSTYVEFSHLSKIRYGKNAENKYEDYLKTLNQEAKKLDVKEEQIEQFLFLFGGHLKKETAA